ncbi:hypothetical protein BOTBODRAFT_182220 [Botryobasidium botryosum FD-172 SS1]|uniref:Uncharacterized protein n=1 Tax=Botryobasidium botryosum (strain FD-172 SS1) TaxID=930990 RepID=A0A067LS20_BOTB1|nr:hypothetical protein BOTBODRAFT_182220 [Botryobasidium botryosum FD-172 SS1]
MIVKRKGNNGMDSEGLIRDRDEWKATIGSTPRVRTLGILCSCSDPVRTPSDLHNSDSTPIT